MSQEKAPILAGKSERLVSLDAFRGLTIAAMVMVNNPGSWSDPMYAPLGHAKWDGWTPTDFIFPFFLFIVGVAMTISFDRRRARGQSRASLFSQVVRRTIILIMLGLILAGFPNFRLITPYILMIVGANYLFQDQPVLGMPEDPAARKRSIFGWVTTIIAVLWFLVDFGYFTGPNRVISWSAMFPLSPAAEGEGGYIRVPGVLQRIALCYFFASIVMLNVGWLGRLAWALLLINGYWIVMRYVLPPAGFELASSAKALRDATEGAPYPGALNDWMDVKLLGAHLYRYRPDPEGLLSTIPAIGTTLMGVLTGNWLATDRSRGEKAVWMCIAGGLLLILGACMDYYFPINKKIWSSSYVVFTAGWALLCLSFCFWLIDVKDRGLWAQPFVVFGTNAILVFFASGLMSRIIQMIEWKTEAGDTLNVKSYIYAELLKPAFDSTKNASLTYALGYVFLWLLLTYPLYRKRIFLKI